MNTSHLTVKSVLVSLALACFGMTGFAACAAPVESSDEPTVAADEQVGTAEEALQNQCCVGYYRCPTTNAVFPWFTGPAALCNDGEHTYPGTAASRCDAACSATCTNITQGCYWP